MNFDFSEEQKLLQRTARDYLADHAPLSLCRSVLESDASYSPELWKGMAEMGWLGVTVPESLGGAGFGPLELALIAHEIGRSLAPVPMSSSVYLATETILAAGSDAQRSEWLPELAAGRRIATWAVVERPGPLAAGAIEARLEGGRLSGRKAPVPDGDVADMALVAAREAGSGDVSLVLAPLDGPDVTRSALPSLDPSRSQAVLEFEDTPVEPLGAPGEGMSLVASALDRAAVLLAFEQIGAAERAFELTREHCTSRYAFGRPIASFQALKHRMADLYCGLELARSNAYYGAFTLHHQSPELRRAACAARISATEALDLAATEMIQMYGGVGYTWEYDCHLFYRRAKWLALLIGALPEWRERLLTCLSPAA